MMSPFLETLLVSLHYIYPATVFIYFIVAFTVAVCTLQTLKASLQPESQPPRRRLIVSLLLFFVLSYVAQFLGIAIQSIIQREWVGQEDVVIGTLSSVLVFGIQLAYLSDTEHPVWYPYYGSWILALVFEPMIEVPPIFMSHPSSLDFFRLFHIILSGLRYCSVLVILGTYSTQLWHARCVPASDEERQPLLPQDPKLNASGNESEGSETTAYGSTSQDDEEEQDKTQTTTTGEYRWEERERKAREEMEKRLQAEGNWLTYIKGFAILFPYCWPVGRKSLQLRFIFVGLCLLAGNALNLLIPRQFGIVVDDLKDQNFKGAWIGVIVYGVLRIAASDSGIDYVRQWLYLPIEFYADEALSTAAYAHILNLSADFHDSKSSSDIMMALYGGHSISDILESVCFQAVPMLIDLVVAVVYLSITFGSYEGLITIATGVLFLYTATRMISGMKEARRRHINSVYSEYYVRQTGIQGWHTVASFNQTGYEDNRYSTAVHTRVSTAQEVRFTWLGANAFQSLVLLCGLLAGAILAVYRIKSGKSTPGDLTMLLMYWAQLTSPLRFMASLGKKLSSDLLDAERLLDIMKQKPTVVNKKGARPIKFVSGDVDFEGVSFSYDNKKGIIKKIDLCVPGGQTVAFVGATGAGKSTLLKLLNRFYDVTDGSIRIDGQDVRDVDISSLRDRIGLVPQNPILFDDTILNNVRYAKITASDQEVWEACKAACIHDKIMGFTDKYNTRVGERGIKLSGGELQRVAIARAILKQPDIVLLDEATSSVDTDTEQKIQESFLRLCQGRTTFIVAHRLSTIMNADRIVVVENGEVIEQGSHNELIGANGRYADLWSKQTFVKPKDADQKMAAMTVQKTTIINDLTPKQTTNELAKTQSKTTPNENGHATPTTKSVQDIQGTKTPSGNKKEGFMLNPVAPEFTPRSVATSTPMVIHTPRAGTIANQPACQPPTALNTQRYRESDEGNLSEDKQRETSDWTSQPPPVVGRPSGRNGTGTNAISAAEKYVGESGQVSPNISDGNCSMRVDDESQDQVQNLPPITLKYPRYSRRVNSKSEPSTTSSGEYDTADTEYDQIEEDVCGSNNSIRRVSAPAMDVAFNAAQMPPCASEACLDTSTSTLKGNDSPFTTSNAITQQSNIPTVTSTIPKPTTIQPVKENNSQSNQPADGSKTCQTNQNRPSRGRP